MRHAYSGRHGWELIHLVTLLSILGSNGIAVPLSPGFPASELRYILDNSEALILLSSNKFKSKAEETLKEGLERSIKLEVVQKIVEGAETSQDVKLEDWKNEQGGMMLYTSGTTSRPVQNPPSSTIEGD